MGDLFAPLWGAIDTPARERSAASVGRFGFLRLLGALRCQGLGLLLTRKRVGLFAGLQQGREDFRHVTHQLGILFAYAPFYGLLGVVSENGK